MRARRARPATRPGRQAGWPPRRACSSPLLGPLRGFARAALDDPALVGTHVRKVGGVEGANLDELFRQSLGAAERPVRVDELDPLPTIPLIRLEDRTNLDLDARLLADLTGERVLEPLAGREEASEETPLRRAETVARQDHVAVRIDTETDDPDEEPSLCAVEDAPLPPARKRVVEDSQQAEQHRGNSTAPLSAQPLFHVLSAQPPSARRRVSSRR